MKAIRQRTRSGRATPFPQEKAAAVQCVGIVAASGAALRKGK
jgi:hypothetical protein